MIIGRIFGWKLANCNFSFICLPYLSRSLKSFGHLSTFNCLNNFPLHLMTQFGHISYTCPHFRGATDISHGLFVKQKRFQKISFKFFFWNLLKSSNERLKLNNSPFHKQLKLNICIEVYAPFHNH